MHPSSPIHSTRQKPEMYNWDGKEDECYRLYVRERKSLKEVATYWEQRGFTPRYVIAWLGGMARRTVPTTWSVHMSCVLLIVYDSKRAFQTQFKVCNDSSALFTGWTLLVSRISTWRTVLG